MQSILTEKRRIEKARTPIKIRMKNEKTWPKALRRLEGVGLVSGAAIDGQNKRSYSYKRVNWVGGFGLDEEGIGSETRLFVSSLTRHSNFWLN